MYKLALLLLLSFNLSFVISFDCEKVLYRCESTNNCRDCLREHHCCQWCYTNENITSPRCSTLNRLSRVCSDDKIERNSISNITNIPLNHKFTDIPKGKIEFDNVFQFKPQAFDIVLRAGMPVNVSFRFKSAKNYPLDLYYLGDLSFSMLDHIEAMKSLGNDLVTSLQSITENFKLAYGSFMDKPVMPFYITATDFADNPCGVQQTQCEKGYLFKHRLNFTRDVESFIKKVNDSKITANLDNLDAALEAIHQILVCQQRIPWSHYSRKIIILATDSLLHTAGDGILGGAARKNFDKCLVDSEGNYTDYTAYDYPDMGNIITLMKQYSTNLIIATKDSKFEYYKRAKKDIFKDRAFVGKLEENSTNILNLVRTGFYDIIKQVNFHVNTSEAEEIDVKFFGLCPGNSEFNETSSCDNVKEGEVIKFIVQLTLKEFSEITSRTLYIKEKNINEQILLNLTYVGNSCKCSGFEGDNLKCKNGGHFECGDCICKSGWTGKTCENRCSEDDFTLCRQEKNGIISSTCYNRGACVCGKCQCENPHIGTFCEYTCPVNSQTRQICSGPNHGECIEGKCVCDDKYEGETCDCEKSQENCALLLNEKLCSDRGTCKCNKCVCNDGFEGNFCEKAKGQENVICTQYEEFVQNYTLDKEQTNYFVDQTQVIITTEKIDCQMECLYMAYTTGSRCAYKYCYERSENNTIELHVISEECAVSTAAMSFTLAIGIFSLIVLLGLLAIGVKKYKNYKLDQAEYARFESESKRLKMNNRNENPLYNSPVTFYNNPLRRRGHDSEDEEETQHL